jgi:hypothetical protein
VRTTIESAKFAKAVAASSGVRESSFRLHACLPRKAGMVDVSVDSPNRSDAEAVASRVAHVASLTVDVTPQSLPGPIVQSVFDRPIIEVDPSGDPTC